MKGLNQNANLDIKIIGFDADDTLWVNEPYYRDTEAEFCCLLSQYKGEQEIRGKLLEVERNNMDLYGFGTKAFVLSLIETALLVSENKASPEIIAKIVGLGKSQIERKNTLLPGVRQVLSALSEKYRLIVATKGDLLDQERKLKHSGLLPFFHHIEIMSDKKKANYSQLLNHLEIKSKEFLMVGNSLKSDILPVVELGGNAIQVPFHITWEYEKVEIQNFETLPYKVVDSLADILKIL